MSIEDLDQIDFISAHTDGYIALTISDHLEWDDNPDHLSILLAKINHYLEFIETGQIYDKYPDAKGRKIVIEIIAKFAPNEDCYYFLLSARKQMVSLGYDLKFGWMENGELILAEIY